MYWHIYWEIKRVQNERDVYKRQVKGLANVEAMNGYAVADKLTPRQFAALTDDDIEQVRALYSA